MKNSAIKLLLILISSLPLFAHGQSLNLQYFGTENGIPQSTINSLLQDRSGNLWIGTLGGVCRYDGHGFTTFSKKNGLADDLILMKIAGYRNYSSLDSKLFEASPEWTHNTNKLTTFL